MCGVYTYVYVYMYVCVRLCVLVFECVCMCSELKKGGKAAEATPGYSLIVYSITESILLAHASENITFNIPHKSMVNS